MKNYYVYFLTNKSHSSLYIGVTNDLQRRIFEHKNKLTKGFTEKYNCTKLIHFEETDCISTAISREKQLKNWHREWKENLIKKNNPNFLDLAKDWFS